MSEIPKATTALPISVQVTVPKTGTLVAIYVDCDRLPWMREDRQVLANINAHLDDITSGRDKPGVLELRKVIADTLLDVLLADDMRVEPYIRLTLEEQIQDGFLSLAAPLEAPWLKCVDYLEYLSQESDNVTPNDIVLLADDMRVEPDVDPKLEEHLGDKLLSLAPPLEAPRLTTKDIRQDEKDSRVVFHPDPADRHLEVHMEFKKDVWLKAVGIVVVTENGTEKLAEREVQRVIKKGEHKLALPSVAVQDYPKLSNVKMQLTLGQGNTIYHAIQAEAWHASELAVTLFVDLGSTRAKMLEVRASENGGSNGVADLARLWKLSKKDVKANEIDGIVFYGPSNTAEFISRFGLPTLTKETLTCKSDKDLGASLGEAVARLGSYYAKQGRFVAQVFWSFPCMEGSGVTRDTVAVSKAASSIASYSIIGPVTVVPEHETLKYRFQGALLCLAKLGRAKVREQKEIRDKNDEVERKLEKATRVYDRKVEEYRKTWWLFRIFKSKPIQPDESQYKFDPPLQSRSFTRSSWKLMRRRS